MRRALALAALPSLVAACATAPPLEPAHVRDGDEISICGELFDTGVPVVLWYDDDGYSAYETRPFFGDEGPRGLRYRPGRAVDDPSLQERVDERGFELDELREVVDQFVVHFDVCGTSENCFRVLQDERKLSVHFLLDIDGTLYQTLDLADQAWHARQANPRSVGVEIAQIGAWDPGDRASLERWYGEDADGVRITVPADYGDGGVRTPAFVGRPAREGLVRGVVNGRELVQYDFTPEQYVSLVALVAALHGELPRIRLDAPRDEEGRVRDSVLSDDEFDAFEGILGHFHVTEVKVDPGPAFDWEGFLTAVRAHAGALEAAPESELDS